MSELLSKPPFKPYHADYHGRHHTYVSNIRKSLEKLTVTQMADTVS